jgi:hypothetical protein
VNNTNAIYDSYIMRSTTYDVVGFRRDVQTVFNGIIAALNQAFPGSDGRPGLGGLTPEEWVHAQPATCALSDF